MKEINPYNSSGRGKKKEEIEFGRGLTNSREFLLPRTLTNGLGGFEVKTSYPRMWKSHVKRNTDV